MKLKQANTYTIQCMWQGISLKSERNNQPGTNPGHDLNHDLIFYCTHNQL